MPIKIVDSTYSNSKSKVVIGTGLATSVPALLNSHSENKKRILLVLLDSGFDGDLVFVQEGTKLDIPFKERNTPQKWSTSNGIFTTTKVGVMDVIFPEFFIPIQVIAVIPTRIVGTAITVLCLIRLV